MQVFNFHIDAPAFLATLPIMLKGLVGIFAVILVVYAFVAILNRATKKK